MQISVTLNEHKKVLDIQPYETLLEVLRREGCKSVKFCDDTGLWGCDTVLLNGNPVISNLTMAAKADGADITTLEGISKDGKLHPLQQAFVDHGAIQCGYHIPGMILTTLAFLKKNPNPTEAEVREALIGNLDRDSGYVKPIEAIMAYIEGKEADKPAGLKTDLKIVNKTVPKVDAEKLVLGRPVFTDDFERPGMLIGKILTSPHAHARIKRINTDKARALPGVHAVLTHEDVPKIRCTKAGQSWPEPSPYDHLILDSKVRHVGDRVALVAAETAQIAENALELIEVDYEVLPAALTQEEAFAPGAPVIHDEDDAKGVEDASRNLIEHLGIEVGSVEEGFKQADIVVENTFRTKKQKHCMPEPHISMSYLDENGRLCIVTSTQVPFHTRRQLAYMLDMPMSHIRIIKPRIGSGFGNKQGMHLEDAVAVLTLKTRRPVKIFYTREEEFLCGWTRHPQTIRMKVGAKNDGKFVAVEMDVLASTGAYGEHATTVQGNTGNKVLPMYPAPNIKFSCDVVYTNEPVCGAFRGYGATQGSLGLEAAVDEIAKALNMDPLDVRKKNRIELNHEDPISKKIGESTHGKVRVIYSCGLGEMIEKGAELIGWKEKHGNPGSGRVRRGLGMACSMQGSGIPGVDWAAVTLKLNEDGTVGIYTGATDLGTGSDTVITQIVAETLGLEMKDLTILSSDTDLTPFDVGAYASSTTYISGGAALKTAQKLRDEILNIAGKMMDEHPADLECTDRKVVSKKTGKEESFKDVAMYIGYKEKKQLTVTESHLSNDSPPPFSVQFVEVSVDTETGYVNVENIVAAVDCGTPINPQLALGQLQGAVAQGLGYGLFEEMVFDDKGNCLNPNFDDYKIFTPADIPNMETFLAETDEPTGPYGGKSVSEVPINCPAPAIGNAIADALGIRIMEFPLTPERVLHAIEKAKAEGKF